MSLPVTIVVCTHNDHQFLRKALESCAQQGVDEVILVDDASTWEPTYDLWNAIRLCGAIYIRHSKKTGLSAARNTGFSLARNQYVFPLDADDWFYPGAIKALYDAAAPADWCVVACGDITEGGQRRYPPMKYCRDPLTGQCRAAKGDWEHMNQGYAGSLIWKPAWNAVGRYHVLPHAHYEDYRLWCEMVRFYGSSGGFKYVDALVYEHTPREDSMLRQLHPRTEEFHKLATEPLRCES